MVCFFVICGLFFQGDLLTEKTANLLAENVKEGVTDLQDWVVELISIAATEITGRGATFYTSKETSVFRAARFLR